MQKQDKKQVSQEQESDGNLQDKLSALKQNVIEIDKSDRIVKITVTMDQICGCGGKDDVEVNRTVPWDSPLQDGDKVEGFDDSDEVLGYV